MYFDIFIKNISKYILKIQYLSIICVVFTDNFIKTGTSFTLYYSYVSYNIT